MTRRWMREFATAGMAFVSVAGVAGAQNTNTNANAAQQPANAAARPAQGAQATGHTVGASDDLPGPIDNLQDLQDAGKMLFKLADTNNDGQISQKEAVDAGNLLVGGFFFRADQNGDGTLTKEEAQQARESLLQQKPILRFVVERTKAQQNTQANGNNATANNNNNPLRGIANLLDANNDKKLDAAELRQAVQTSVQGVFATADTNRDGQLSTTEINAGMIGAARAASDAAFQSADTDNNGQLSREEYDKAIVEPANAIFAIIDKNNDGQLSQQEIKSARRLVVSQLRMLRVPEPPNSAANLINTGRKPEEVAPVPAVGSPTRPRQ